MGNPILEQALSQENDEELAVNTVSTVQEIEHVWYLKLIDFNQLNNAPFKESYLQAEYWMFDDDGKRSGVIRSRMINGGERYELTIKNYDKSYDGAMETTIVASTPFEAINKIATNIIRKVRYRFPTGVAQGDESTGFFEVDVFVMPDGSNYPWVKVDFEVPDLETHVPALPFKYSEIITMGGSLTNDQMKIVDKLYNDVNLHVNK